MAGAFMSAGDYVHASRRRLVMIAAVEDVLRQVDVLLCASAMDPPSRIDWHERLGLLRLREPRAQQHFGGGLLFQPHPRPTIAGVAGVQKDHPGSVKGPLIGVQGRAARIHNPALGIFDRDLG
jgi:hypothetical protein